MPTVNFTRERSLYKAFSEQAVKARQTELAQIQEQLSTNRRVNRPSDDASAFAQARQLEALGERYAQYQRSIDSARSWSDHSQQSLDELADLFTQVYEEAVRFSNGTYSDSDRQSGVKTLQSLLGTITDQLNTRVNGEYLFAGSRTTVKPFTLDTATSEITYNGNDGGRERHIGRDVTLNINISGEDLFNLDAAAIPPVTLSSVMNDLLVAVGSGDPVELEAALGGIELARNHVVDLGGEAGNIGQRLLVAERQLADTVLLNETRRVDVEGIDLAETLFRQQQAQTGLQTSLRVAANVLQTSLLDYLR